METDLSAGAEDTLEKSALLLLFSLSAEDTLEKSALLLLYSLSAVDTLEKSALLLLLFSLSAVNTFTVIIQPHYRFPGLTVITDIPSS